MECSADSVRLSATAMFTLWTHSHSATLLRGAGGAGSGGCVLPHAGFPVRLLEFQGTELQEALEYCLFSAFRLHSPVIYHANNPVYFLKKHVLSFFFIWPVKLKAIYQTLYTLKEAVSMKPVDSTLLSSSVKFISSVAPKGVCKKIQCFSTCHVVSS